MQGGDHATLFHYQVPEFILSDKAQLLDVPHRGNVEQVE
jgi:hypothetical protein